MIEGIISQKKGLQNGQAHLVEPAYCAGDRVVGEDTDRPTDIRKRLKPTHTRSAAHTITANDTRICTCSEASSSSL